MKTITLMLLLVLLSSCINQSKVDQTPTIVTGESTTESQEESEPKQSRALISERVILRESYGLYDFSILTTENCNSEIERFEFRIIKHRENIEDSKETLKQKQDQYQRKLEIFESLRNSNDDISIMDAKKDMEDALHAKEQVEDQIEDAEKFLKRMEFTLDEIKRECKELRAAS